MAEARATGFPGSFGLELGDLGLDLLCCLERKESQPLLEPGDSGFNRFSGQFREEPADPVLSRVSGPFRARCGGRFGYIVVFE